MTSAIAGQATQPLVTATALSIRFGNRRVLTDVSLQVDPSAELVVMGRSGSGKTTLLLALAGLLEPDAGTARWPGLPSDLAGRRAAIGMVFQSPSLLPELTAAENVSLPLRLRGWTVADAGNATGEALRLVGIPDAAQALPAQLSGGMQQRVAVARVLAGRPRLVLADEPTGSLDRKNAFTVLETLRDAVRRSGGALVIATHDPELAALLRHAAVLEEGRLRPALQA